MKSFNIVCRIIATALSFALLGSMLGCILLKPRLVRTEPEPVAVVETTQLAEPPPVATPVKKTPKPKKTNIKISEDGSWTNLFDGKTLDGWKVSDFGGKPEEISVADGRILLDFGSAELAGVTYLGDVPRMNFEATLEAMRVEGGDFFCGFTFPYEESCCSLVVGGWGGSLVGISSFEYMDASENETTVVQEFENGRWYQITVRVTPNRIRAWIDGEKVVDARPGERKVSVRWEVEASQPFGVAAWNTKAAVRDIRLRVTSPVEANDDRDDADFSGLY